MFRVTLLECSIVPGVPCKFSSSVIYVHGVGVVRFSSGATVVLANPSGSTSNLKKAFPQVAVARMMRGTHTTFMKKPAVTCKDNLKYI